METFQAKKEQGNYSVAEENLKILMDKISSVSMDNIIDVSSREVTYNHDNIMAEFPLKKQQMMDEFVDRLSHRLHLRVLFLSHDNNRGEYRSVLYAMPYPEEMYVIHLTSYQYGLVNEMKVVFYDSMDIMQRNILRFRDNASGEILQMTNDSKIIKDFG